MNSATLRARKLFASPVDRVHSHRVNSLHHGDQSSKHVLLLLSLLLLRAHMFWR
jgi:hypothetical protein